MLQEAVRNPKCKLIACGLLSAVVLHTALRIEHLNALNGGYLPRQDLDQGGNRKWRAWSEAALLGAIENRIRIERVRRFEESFERAPTEEEVRELWLQPLSLEEERFGHQELEKSRIRKKLHWWVAGPGLLQHFLAPLVFLWAIYLILEITSLPCRCRFLPFVFAGAAALSIHLMIYRGYFASLGW